jgi:ABC-type multidrug transport system ATPase subunit
VIPQIIGQRHRTHLAVFFTLFTLAQRRLAFQPHFLFLDEVFDYLDATGQIAVQRWIDHVLRQKNNPIQRIFVVTHSQHIIPNAKGFITADFHPIHGSRYVVHNDSNEEITNTIFEYPNDEEIENERKRKAIMPRQVGKKMKPSIKPPKKAASLAASKKIIDAMESKYLTPIKAGDDDGDSVMLDDEDELESASSEVSSVSSVKFIRKARR